MNTYHIPESFKPGASASISRTITEEDVSLFASLSGDKQPLHLDEKYASGTRFKHRIAHGALLVGMVSAVLGGEMADPEATIIFLGLEITFAKPVYIGDTIDTTCETVEVRDDKPIVTLKISCSNQDHEQVMNGTAAVYIDRYPI